MHKLQGNVGVAYPLKPTVWGGLAGLFLGVGLIGGVWGTGLVFPSQAHAAVPSAFLEGFADIVEKVGPAVVNVAVTSGGGPGAASNCLPVPLAGLPVAGLQDVLRDLRV